MEFAIGFIGTFIIVRFLSNLLSADDKIDRILDEELGSKSVSHYNRTL